MLYDAVTLVLFAKGLPMFSRKRRRVTVADGSTNAMPLHAKEGLARDFDKGTIERKDQKTVATFFEEGGHSVSGV